MGSDALAGCLEARRPSMRRRAARAATAFTAAAVAGGAVTFHNLAWGKYGGRVLADVDGRSRAAALIAAGHGRP